MEGMISPSATAKEELRFAFNSSKSVSSPAINIKRITPTLLNCVRSSEFSIQPNTAGPITIPTN